MTFPVEIAVGGLVALLWLGVVIVLLNMLHHDKVFKARVAWIAASVWAVCWIGIYILFLLFA